MGERASRMHRWVAWVLGGVAVAEVALLLAVFVNHVGFPLYLDLMEGTVLQHVQRLAAGEPVYPAPDAGFVALAYNPLYYVMCVPVTWVLGLTLSTLRIVAMVGTLGCGWILFDVVRRKTGSAWWGLMTAGVFAAAYRVMDAYLDTAHSDSWLLLAALAGSYVIDRTRSRWWHGVGVVLLVASFWFKQHGGLFALGGVSYLTWRWGWWRALPFWVLAAVTGPGLWLLAGGWLFGSHFHYFTWTVPSRWSEITLRAPLRIGAFVAQSYPVLAASAVMLAGWTAVRRRWELDIWQVQLVAAVLSGVMGTLDAGSSDNVYIPMGCWLILVGMLGLHRLAMGVSPVLLIMTFCAMAYNPATVWRSSQADRCYGEFVAELNGLDGPVYAPWLGQLPSGTTLYPAAHWVGLEDLVRGPGRDVRSNPTVEAILLPGLTRNTPQYIVANQSTDSWLFRTLFDFVATDCVLVADWGDRFKALRVLPGRYDHRWPRFLYRYAPAGG